MITRVCALCGYTSSQPVPPEAESLGPPNLDTRPAAPLGQTVSKWMQSCPKCWYAAPDIAASATGAREIVDLPDYQAEEDPFLRHAFILERMGFFADAGWTALHSSWAADDRIDTETADRARRRAIDLWRHGKAHGQPFGESHSDEFALVTDVLRRSGDFDAALAACLDALDSGELPPIYEDIMRFQRALVERRDSDPHNLGEIPERPPNAERVTL